MKFQRQHADVHLTSEVPIWKYPEEVEAILAIASSLQQVLPGVVSVLFLTCPQQLSAHLRWNNRDVGSVTLTDFVGKHLFVRSTEMLGDETSSIPSLEKDMRARIAIAAKRTMHIATLLRGGDKKQYQRGFTKADLELLMSLSQDLAAN